MNKPNCCEKCDCNVLSEEHRHARAHCALSTCPCHTAKTYLTKAKVIELVPEIVELGIGCRISHFLKGTGTILRVEKHEGESDTYLLGFLALPEPLFEREPRNLNWDILGRPITLADVLRAVDKTVEMVAVDESGYIMKQTGASLQDNAYEEVKAEQHWNLTTDYDGQTQEVKEFIGKLLGV